MHRYLCIVIGRWKLENWHLYHYRPSCNHNRTVKWHMWERVL